MYLVPNIDVDMLEIPGNLGVHVHDLIRLELTGQAEDVRDGPALYRADRGGGMRPCIWSLPVLASGKGKA
jgi:hypothetical protein